MSHVLRLRHCFLPEALPEVSHDVAKDCTSLERVIELKSSADKWQHPFAVNPRLVHGEHHSNQVSTDRFVMSDV